MPRTPLSASIVIDSFNYGRFLSQCIDSALDQTVAAQIVVSDDGSTDGSPEIIRSYQGSVLGVLRSRNGGQAAALNDGIAASSGDIVLLLDSDDWIRPHRVERVLRVFSEHPSIQAVRHDAVLVDLDGNVLTERQYGLIPSMDPAADLLQLGGTFASTGTLAFRRSFLEELGDIPEDCYHTHPDFYLKLAACLSGRFATIGESLTVRRVHSAQLTHRFATDRGQPMPCLGLRSCMAENAKQLAIRYNGPEVVAAGSTWWQRKSLYEHRKGLPGNGAWLRLWLLHLYSVLRAPLPTRRKLGEAVRSLFLGALPRRLFLRAWWWSHIGRPALRGGRLFAAKPERSAHRHNSRPRQGRRQ